MQCARSWLAQFHLVLPNTQHSQGMPAPHQVLLPHCGLSTMRMLSSPRAGLPRGRTTMATSASCCKSGGAAQPGVPPRLRTAARGAVRFSGDGRTLPTVNNWGQPCELMKPCCTSQTTLAAAPRALRFCSASSSCTCGRQRPHARTRINPWHAPNLCLQKQEQEVCCPSIQNTPNQQCPAVQLPRAWFRVNPRAEEITQ